MKNQELEKVSVFQRLMLKISPNLFWKNIEKICAYSFSDVKINSITIPETVNEIGIAAFAENKFLKKVVLPKNINQLPSKGFFKCINLKEISFPQSLETIHECCFTGCGFESIFIPKNIEQIMDLAFSFNKNLEKIELESTGTYIHHSAFNSSENIKTIKIGENIFNVSKNQKILNFFTDDNFNQIAILENENKNISLAFIDENQSVVAPIYDEKLIHKLFSYGAGNYDYSVIKEWQISKSNSSSKTIQKAPLPDYEVMIALGNDNEMINAFYKTKANGFDYLKKQDYFSFQKKLCTKLFAALGGFEENASHQKRALEVLNSFAYEIPSDIEIPAGVSHTRAIVTEYAHDKNNKPIFKDGMPVEKGKKVVKYHNQICSFIEKFANHNDFHYVIHDVLTKYPEIHKFYKKQLAYLNPNRNPNGDLEQYNKLKQTGIDVAFVLDYSRRYSYNYKNTELGDALVKINWRLTQEAVTEYDKFLTLAKKITEKAISENKQIKVFSNDVVDKSNNPQTYFWPPITSAMALTIGERFGTCFSINGRNEAAIEYILSSQQDALILIMEKGEPIAYCRVNYDAKNKGILIDNIELNKNIYFMSTNKEIWDTCIRALKDMQKAMNQEGKYPVERINCKPDPYNKVFADIKDYYPKASEINAKTLIERHYNSARDIRFKSYYANYDKNLEQIVISSPEIDNQKEI